MMPNSKDSVAVGLLRSIAEKNIKLEAEIERLRTVLKAIADGHEAPHWLAAKALEQGLTL